MDIRKYFRLETVQNFLKLFSGTVLAQGLSFVLSPVLSRLYTPEEFGLVALYLGILSIVSVLATAKYEQAIMLPQDDEAAFNIFALVAGLCFVFSCLTFFLVLLFNDFIAVISGNPEIGPWLWFLPLSILFHGIFQASTFLANRAKKFGSIARTTIIQNLTLNITRVGIGGAGWPLNGLVAGQLAAQFVSAAYLTTRIRSKISAGFRLISFRKIKNQATHYSAYPKYNMFQNFTTNLSGSLPVLMFSWGISPEAAGLYGFAYMFVFKPLGLFSLSMQQVFQQKIIEQHHQGISIMRDVKQLVVRFALAGLLPFIILAVWAPSIFTYLFSAGYTETGVYVSILTPWLFMIFLTSHLSFLPELFFRQRKAMTINVIALFLRFSALYAGIWYEDVILAIALLSAVSTVQLIYTLFWYLYITRKNDVQ